MHPKGSQEQPWDICIILGYLLTFQFPKIDRAFGATSVVCCIKWHLLAISISALTHFHTLDWPEPYKNAKLLKKGALIFRDFPRDAHDRIANSKYKLHISSGQIIIFHTVDFPEPDFPSLACFAYLLSFINDQVFRQDSSSVSASHRTCVFSKDCEKHTVPAKDELNCFAKCYPKTCKFICLVNDCRATNSLDFWVSWLKKNGFNIFCSYQRC